MSIEEELPNDVQIDLGDSRPPLKVKKKEKRKEEEDDDDDDDED